MTQLMSVGKAHRACSDGLSAGVGFGVGLRSAGDCTCFEIFVDPVEDAGHEFCLRIRR